MAAPLVNYSGATKLADLVIRPEFWRYITEEIYYQSLMLQSGAVIREPALDARAGGVKVEVPTYLPIDPTEEVIESSSTWGTSGKGYLTPQAITAGKQIAPILHRGFSYAVGDIARLGTGTDPLGEIRNYLGRAINRLKMKTLISQLDGLFGSALNPLETDVSKDDIPANLGPENYLTAATAIAAKSKLGEHADRLQVIVMPSACYFYLQQAGMLTFSSNSLSAGSSIQWQGGGIGVSNDTVAQFAGMRVIVDDNIVGIDGASKTNGNALRYPVYLCANGAIAEGVQQDLRIEFDRNILSLQDVLAMSYSYGYHVFGTAYKGPDGPDNANLANPSNYDLVYTDIRSINMVRLLVNTPFGGVTGTQAPQLSGRSNAKAIK